jgi:hypothetical protein
MAFCTFNDACQILTQVPDGDVLRNVKTAPSLRGNKLRLLSSFGRLNVVVTGHFPALKTAGLDPIDTLRTDDGEKYSLYYFYAEFIAVFQKKCGVAASHT